MTTKRVSGQKEQRMWKTEQKVKAYVESTRMLEDVQQVVLGVSGGADSVCLLRILGKLRQEWNLSLTAVHIHHGLRGEEADADEHFVQQLCKQEQVNCRSFHFDVRSISEQEKMGLEEAGRKVRYACFEQVCQELGGAVIALAHHGDDQAETMLHHLARGTGIKGLCGMKPIDGNRIRPLLCLEKKEILEYLDDVGQPYQTDSSNLEDGYTRNRIRHHVLEELKTQVNKNAVLHMAQVSQELQEMNQFLEMVVDEKWNRYAIPKEGAIVLTEDLKLEPELIQRCLIRKGIEEQAGQTKNLMRVHMQAVCELLEKQVGAHADLPYGVFAQKMYDGVVIGKKEKSGADQKKQEKKQISLEINTEGKKVWTALGNMEISSQIQPYDFGEIEEKKYTKWFDYDKIKQNLVIRHRQPGDRICLFDQGGTKKLKDYLIDRKIPVQEREELWLLADGSEIVWILGDRISAYYKVTERSRKVLQVEIKGGNTHE